MRSFLVFSRMALAVMVGCHGMTVVDSQLPVEQQASNTGSHLRRNLDYPTCSDNSAVGSECQIQYTLDRSWTPACQCATGGCWVPPVPGFPPNPSTDAVVVGRCLGLVYGSLNDYCQLNCKANGSSGSLYFVETPTFAPCAPGLTCKLPDTVDVSQAVDGDTFLGTCGLE